MAIFNIYEINQQKIFWTSHFLFHNVYGSFMNKNRKRIFNILKDINLRPIILVFFILSPFNAIRSKRIWVFYFNKFETIFFFYINDMFHEGSTFYCMFYVGYPSNSNQIVNSLFSEIILLAIFVQIWKKYLDIRKSESWYNK